VLTEQAVLLAIEVLQLLAAMSEQPGQQLPYDSIDAYRHAALLLQGQLVALQSCSALGEQHSSMVQQSAQQLMQLLRWQLQQAAHRSTPPSGAEASAYSDYVLDTISGLAEETLFGRAFVNCSGACIATCENGVSYRSLNNRNQQFNSGTSLLRSHAVL
jgi:hypothetical protein